MMQKILKLYNKLKSSKGATGADIVVALSAIVLAIGAISIIYINLSYGSRKVNRTAGATRIATNIIENIKSLNYDDVNSFIEKLQDNGYENKSSEAAVDINEITKIYINNDAGKTVTIKINGKKTDGATKIFNTKIPKGYNLELVFTTISDTSTPEEDRKPTFDLIKKIDVTVYFKVRDNTESVSLSSSIERETLKEVNSPDLTSDILPTTVDIIEGGVVTSQETACIIPIKYSTIMGTYVPTTESDSEWYNYSNKNWAMVYVDTEENVNKAKASGKINTAEGSNYEKKIYYWIPRFYSKKNNGIVTESGFLFGTTNYPIIQTELTELNGSSILKVYSKASTAVTDAYISNIEARTGIWVQKEDASSDVVCKEFSMTKFGPAQH